MGIKSLSKELQQKQLTLILVVLLLCTLATIVSFVTIFYLPTAGWLSYKSSHVSLSFKYPKDWPISQCSEPILFHQMKIEEVVYFDKECDWRQYQTSIGDVTVQKVDDIDAYFKGFDGTAKIYGYGGSLKPVQIGNKTGYLLVYIPHPTKPPLEPSPKGKTYYVVANNLVYTINLNERNFYKGSEAETIRTFERILSTFQF